jgi:hypothetical protein
MPMPKMDCSKNRVKSNCEHETPGPKRASLDGVQGTCTAGGIVSGGNEDLDIGDETAISKFNLKRWKNEASSKSFYLDISDTVPCGLQIQIQSPHTAPG